MNIEIKKAIENDELILFVGAGMSIPLGFPNWTDLIITILKKLKEDNQASPFNFNFHISQGNDMDVLDVLKRLEKEGFKSKTKKILYQEIEKIKLKKEKLIRQTKLWEISDKIITTNYDKAIDKVMPENIKFFSNNNIFQQAQSIQGKPYLYKIHGNIDNPDTCILFPSDYEELYGDKNSNKKTLKNFFTNKTILFLGFSLEDPFVTKQLKHLSSLYHGYGREHYIVQTKHTDFSKYNVKTIEIENWNEGFDTFLDELIDAKKNYQLEDKTNTDTKEDVDISKIKDLVLLNEMYNHKKEEFDKSEDNDKTNLAKNLYELRNRILELQAYKFDLDFKTSIPKHQEKELEHIFDEILNSEKIKPQLISKINEIKDQHSSKYKWHHRSVIISGLACSLINHKKVDPRKIDLLIDFTNDSEDKVWEKAVTYLFLALNHLGNKWKRFMPNLKPKLERLTEHKKIQEALKTIITLMQLKLQNVSFLDAKILNNDYFKDSPFNYFMPFYEDNPSIEKLYDDENIEDVESYIKFIHEIPLPDATKYLICNDGNKSKSQPKKNDKKELKTFVEALNIHANFEPYINHVNTIVNFFENSPKINVVFKQKVSVINFKNILLNTIEHHRAFARQAMIDKSWGTAISRYEQILKIEQNEINTLFNLAVCYDNAKKDVDDRLQLRLRIEKIAPKNENNLLQLGVLYNIKKKYKIEITYYDKCIKINKKSSDAFLLRGGYKNKLDDDIGAIEDYNKAIYLDDKRVLAYVYRGVSNNNLKFYTEAVKDFDKAISLDKKNILAYIGRGFAKAHLTNYNEAIIDLDKAISLDSKNTEAISYKANTLRKINKTDKAHKLIDKALFLNEKTPEFYGIKAAIYASEGNDTKFYELLEKAFSLKAKAKWLDDDIIEKYKNEEQFKKLLKKYNQILK